MHIRTSRLNIHTHVCTHWGLYTHTHTQDHRYIHIDIRSSVLYLHGDAFKVFGVIHTYTYL